MNNRVFVSTPISGFSDEREYNKYRDEVIKFISFLRNNGFDVCAEIEKVYGVNDYDSPSKSVEMDFARIKDCDYFILLHPKRIQSSSLIECGYACALDKKIVAVGKRNDFPYLIIGYEEFSDKAKNIEVQELSDEVYPHILNILKSL